MDYVASLGVDAIWLSPVFPSPMKDFGYDVADYTDIDPLFGDLATFDRLVDAAHARGLKIVMDYAEPLVGPASLVHRVAVLARQSEG